MRQRLDLSARLAKYINYLYDSLRLRNIYTTDPFILCISPCDHPISIYYDLHHLTTKLSGNTNTPPYYTSPPPPPLPLTIKVRRLYKDMRICTRV